MKNTKIKSYITAGLVLLGGMGFFGCNNKENPKENLYTQKESFKENPYTQMKKSIDSLIISKINDGEEGEVKTTKGFKRWYKGGYSGTPHTRTCTDTKDHLSKKDIQIITQKIDEYITFVNLSGQPDSLIPSEWYTDKVPFSECAKVIGRTKYANSLERYEPAMQFLKKYFGDTTCIEALNNVRYSGEVAYSVTSCHICFDKAQEKIEAKYKKLWEYCVKLTDGTTKVTFPSPNELGFDAFLYLAAIDRTLTYPKGNEDVNELRKDPKLLAHHMKRDKTIRNMKEHASYVPSNFQWKSTFKESYDNIY